MAVDEAVEAEEAGDGADVEWTRETLALDDMGAAVEGEHQLANAMSSPFEAEELEALGANGHFDDGASGARENVPLLGGTGTGSRASPEDVNIDARIGSMQSSKNTSTSTEGSSANDVDRQMSITDYLHKLDVEGIHNAVLHNPEESAVSS